MLLPNRVMHLDHGTLDMCSSAACRNGLDHNHGQTSRSKSELTLISDGCRAEAVYLTMLGIRPLALWNCCFLGKLVLNGNMRP